MLLIVSTNLFLLGSKKVQRASHPYLTRLKNSSPLSKSYNITNQPSISIYPPPQMDPNLTELQGNVTQPQWDIGPLRSHDGYEGSNDHFGVKFNVIKIKNTDAVLSHRPSEEQRQLTIDDEKGLFSEYELQAVGDETYQLWMRKIGPYVAEWALCLPRHGAFSCELVIHRFGLTTCACVTRESPMEAHEIPKELHALGPQVRRPIRPWQPSHRRLSAWRAAPGAPHRALSNHLNDIPLPNGIRSPRHMAHEG